MRRTASVNRGTTPLLGLTYTYGAVSSENNGNVMTQAIQPLGATQSYTYDGMNRLDVFTETRSGLSFTQEFGYDRYGNRWLKSMTGGIPTGVPNGEAWFNTATNRLGLTHDADGNLKALSPYTGRYTAENLLGELESTGNGSAKFEYDGEGRRVKKITCGTSPSCTAGTSGAVVTVYVYDAMGNQAAEYGPINETGTKYLFADALGSTRVTTDGSGNTVRRYDYAPFGEELTSARTSWRTTAAGYYGTDNVPLKFTGKERDTLTGLDYFGARYYGSSYGRFESPDTPLVDQHTENPQSWNLYAYVRNNPLRFVDPLGREAISKAQCDANPDCIRMQLNVVYDRNANIYDKDGNLLPQYQKALNAQLARARDEYGTLGIYLDVTETEGAVDFRSKTISHGVVASALNVALTDSQALSNSGFVAGAKMQGGMAIVIENMTHADVHSGTLGHEIAHHLSGEARSGLAGWVNLFTFGSANAYTDTVNNARRSMLQGAPAFSQTRVLTGVGGKAPEVVQDPWRLNARRFFGGR